MSGLTRIATGAFSDHSEAIASICLISSIDSALICPMPLASARRISSSVLPTPEKTISFGAMPAAERALHLTTRDDISACPLLCQQEIRCAKWLLALTANEPYHSPVPQLVERQQIAQGSHQQNKHKGACQIFVQDQQGHHRRISCPCSS